MTVFKALHFQGQLPIAVRYGMVICLVASIARVFSILQISEGEDLRLHTHLAWFHDIFIERKNTLLVAVNSSFIFDPF